MTEPAADDWDGEGAEPVVRAGGVCHHFGQGEARKQVLHAISLELRPGEIVIMTGPSGSGKTTLLTLIGALRSVQEGSLSVLGRELSTLSAGRLVDVRREIGFIFQAHNLFEALTAAQNVRLALDLHAGPSAAKAGRAAEVLARLGLGERLHYKPHALSGGQRQRVAIARALVNRPRLVLADEPTAALDRDAGREAIELLRQLAREDRCTVMIVTHDSRILDAADRMINMVDGHVVSNVVVRQALMLCEFLRKCPTFANQSPAVLSEMAEKMVREQHRAGGVVIRQGDEGDRFYVIGRGACDVVREDGGQSRLLTTLRRGDFFGEVALLTGRPRNATVVAHEDTVLYWLGQADFKAVLDSSHSLKDQVLRVLFQRQ
jgi:putative ABC transport system ATP-binding protein